jgi:beta-carotene/zeaxanthin 4-ketolase
MKIHEHHPANRTVSRIAHRTASRADSYVGIAIAVAIIMLWAVHLVLALTLDLQRAHPALLVAMFFVQTFLYTGLFITAHDAMHGSICRHFRRLNGALGGLAVVLYALFSYKKLWVKHWEHHRHVATPHADPDFHDGEHTSFAAWYAHFLLNYVGWKQLMGMALAFNLLQHGAGISVENLLLFWVAPSLASTVQLFFFGTYLPHRPSPHHQSPEHQSPPHATSDDERYERYERHHSNPNDWHWFWSFLACYHFGYHGEHHDAPSTPWWRLPALHRQWRKSLTSPLA